jgi:hypothetical protein
MPNKSPLLALPSSYHEDVKVHQQQSDISMDFQITHNDRTINRQNLLKQNVTQHKFYYMNVATQNFKTPLPCFISNFQHTKKKKSFVLGVKI